MTTANDYLKEIELLDLDANGTTYQLPYRKPGFAQLSYLIQWIIEGFAPTFLSKDKMDSIVNSISGMIGSIKSKVAELIFNLVDSPAAEFLLPESMRNSIKDFATSMKSSGDEAVKRNSAAELS